MRELDWKGPQPDWLVCMKFGQTSHLEAFRRGELYTQPLQFFAAIEDDELRGDSFEGVCRIAQPQDISKLSIKSQNGDEIVISGEMFRGPVLMSYGEEINCNVFCMFSVINPANCFCDFRNHKFGDSFVIVLDTNEFLQRASRGAKDRGFSLDFALIEYFDPKTHSGRTGPFRKPKQFSHQKEFRLSLTPSTSCSYVLDIGDISDITTPPQPLAQFNTLLKFE